MNNAVAALEKEKDVSVTSAKFIEGFEITNNPFRYMERNEGAIASGVTFFVNENSIYGSIQSVTSPGVLFVNFGGQTAVEGISDRLKIGPIYTEHNPIVRISPNIGKRYPMQVVGSRRASFKKTSLRMM